MFTNQRFVMGSQSDENLEAISSKEKSQELSSNQLSRLIVLPFFRWLGLENLLILSASVSPSVKREY